MRLRGFVGVSLVLLFGCIFPGAQDPLSQAKPDPTLIRRPPLKTPSSVALAGRIRLDVVVSDAQGKPVHGLEPWDFQVTDDGKPAKILSFRGFDGVAAKPDPPVEVILLIDEVNLPFQQVAFVRKELTRFLRHNDGKLAQPVSIMRLTDAGLRVQSKPALDGNALVSIVNQIKGEIGYINPAMGGGGALQRFQISARDMATIAENEATKRGRKLLLWVGPGWPMLEGAQFETSSDLERRRYFDAIVELANKLREARITVNSVSGSDPSAGDPSSHALFYQLFLKPVPSPREASSGNLALKVLVVQTGGRILGPGNDLAEQINECVADASAFYSISFNPPPAGHADEFHGLKVQIAKPGLTVRTNTGYYNEPKGN
jgi:VWFA-related protein